MTLIKNKWLLLVVVALMSATTTRAQVLSDILSKIKNAAGAVQSSAATSSVIDNLIGSSKVSFKQISGTWNYTSPAIPNIIFYKNRASKVRITANAKVGTTLQVTFKTDKLLQFAQHFGQIAGSQLTSLQTLNNLIGKYKGLQVGMRFKR